MNKLRALLTFGTRPEAVKMAPVVHECRRRADRIEPIVCTTGQHREMLDQVTAYFDIQPELRSRSDAARPDAGRGDRPVPDRLGRGDHRVPAALRGRPGGHHHGDGLGIGGVLPPAAVCPRRGRAADRQPPGPLARGTQPPHRRAGYDAALRADRRGGREPAAGRRPARSGPRHRQHGDRRPVVDRGPRARAGPPLAGEIRRCWATAAWCW